MQSKNKPAPTRAEAEHIERIKLMPCCVCGCGGGFSSPSEAHEIEQGLWFTSIPLCADCHRGEHNGIHGRRAIWKVKKLDELKALNLTLGRLLAANDASMQRQVEEAWRA